MPATKGKKVEKKYRNFTFRKERRRRESELTGKDF